MKPLFEFLDELLGLVQRRAAILLALLAVCIGSVSAVTFIASNFTAIVIRPSGTAESDTNTFRIYSANGTNWMGINTNGVPYFHTAIGDFTGFTGSIMATNAAGGVLSNRFLGGWHVGTNGAQPTPQ